MGILQRSATAGVVGISLFRKILRFGNYLVAGTLLSVVILTSVISHSVNDLAGSPARLFATAITLLHQDHVTPVIASSIIDKAYQNASPAVSASLVTHHEAAVAAVSTVLLSPRAESLARQLFLSADVAATSGPGINLDTNPLINLLTTAVHGVDPAVQATPSHPHDFIVAISPQNSPLSYLNSISLVSNLSVVLALALLGVTTLLITRRRRWEHLAIFAGLPLLISIVSGFMLPSFFPVGDGGVARLASHYLASSVASRMVSTGLMWLAVVLLVSAGGRWTSRRLSSRGLASPADHEPGPEPKSPLTDQPT